MSYKVVLFDLDGTIIDPKKGVSESAKYALDSLKIEIDSDETFDRFIGPPLHRSFQNFYNLSDDKAKEAVAKYREHYAVHGIDDNEIYPNGVEIFEYLKEKGYILAIATSKPQLFAEQILKKLEIFDYFDTVIGSDINETNADKTNIIANVIKKYPDNKNNEFVMIGDRMFDMIGANENDIDCIGALWGYGDFQELVMHDPKFCLKNFLQVKFVL